MKFNDGPEGILGIGNLVLLGRWAHSRNRSKFESVLQPQERQNIHDFA